MTVELSDSGPTAGMRAERSGATRLGFLALIVVGAAVLVILTFSTSSNPQTYLAWMASAGILVAVVALALAPFRTFAAGLLLAFGFLTIRPSLIADQAPFIGLVPLIASTALSGARLPQRRAWLWIVVLAIAIAFPAFSSRPGDLQYLATQALSAAIVGACIVSVAHGAAQRRAAVAALTAVIAWQAVAFAIARLTNFAGAITFVPSSGSRSGWAYLLSPLGALSGFGPGFGSEPTQRLLGWLPEPGLLAAAATLTTLMWIALRMRHRWVPATTTFGTLILSESYGGIVVAIIGVCFLLLSYRGVRTKRHVVRSFGWVLIVATIVAISVDSPLSIAAKEATNGSSVSDRLGRGSAFDLFVGIATNPTGTGSSGPNAEINLLQSSLTNGILMLLLWVLVYAVIPLAKLSAARTRYVPVVAGILACVLFSQPPFYELWIALSALTVANMRASTSAERDGRRA